MDRETAMRLIRHQLALTGDLPCPTKGYAEGLAAALYATREHASEEWAIVPDDAGWIVRPV